MHLRFSSSSSDFSQPLTRWTRTLPILQSGDSFDLFKITRLLTVSSKREGNADAASKFAVDDMIGEFEMLIRESDENVRIQTVGYGGHKSHQYFAIYCTNGMLFMFYTVVKISNTSIGQLIFRYEGESGLPVVRHFEWYKVITCPTLTHDDMLSLF